MLRRRPRLRTAATLTSLALCLTTAILWLRCEGTGSDEFELYWLGRGFGIHSLAGDVFLSTFTNRGQPTTWLPRLHVNRDHRESAGMWSFMVVYQYGHHAGALGYGSVDLTDPQAFRPSARVIMIPHGYLVGLFAILPIVHLALALRRRHRKRIGHCPTCGYDLRATPDRCPECGATAAASS